MSNSSSLSDAAWREVVALHAFFEGWFRVDCEPPDFAECDAALGPDFSMIGPDGVTHHRDAVIPRLRQMRGVYPADFRINVVDPRAVWVGEDAVLLEYTEQQYRAGGSDARRSTALFNASTAAPRGVVWRHLQETWTVAPRV